MKKVTILWENFAVTEKSEENEKTVEPFIVWLAWKLFCNRRQWFIKINAELPNLLDVARFLDNY